MPKDGIAEFRNYYDIGQTIDMTVRRAETFRTDDTPLAAEALLAVVRGILTREGVDGEWLDTAFADRTQAYRDRLSGTGETSND